ncbi:Ig-like domain-containing protein [Erwinia sp. HR93]|uniref:Ig-like domain-containing protein n=1 Tax=Erwinia sp. HR93 TaxID=3094840 RepID=UPI002ADEF57F|nr:Ig-like domain-containing protein [Erwinia sp. HR93]MEA1064238.1 Ig-like domain-containing protein [Erwinia sp. HR93]
MSKKIILVTRHADGKNENVSVSQENPAKVKIKSGYLYLLKNEGDNFAPENITLKRNGNDLEVMQEGDEKPSLTLKDYFEYGDDASPLLLGMAEDGQLYQYIPVSDVGYDAGYLITDSELVAAALGGETLGPGAPYFESDDSNSNLYPLLFGLLAAAGAIGAGVALHEHNTKGHHHHDPVDITPPVSKGIDSALDNTGAITGKLKSGDITDETHPQLSGSGEPGNTITIYDNGKKIGETNVDRNGNWRWTPDNRLADGDHTLTTTERDAAGNISKPSPGFDLTVDSTAPQTPPAPDAHDNVGDKQGPIHSGDVTDDSTPTLNGRGTPGDTVDVWDNGEKIGSATVDPDGNWTWTPDQPLADGDHSLSTTVTDPAGNVSEPSPGLDITVDTQPPATPDAPWPAITRAINRARSTAATAPRP